jgi:hypothetical protein
MQTAVFKINPKVNFERPSEVVLGVMQPVCKSIQGEEGLGKPC